MRADTYQFLLILTGVIVTALFGIFLFRELFPEYKIYQDDYIALEEFRSTYTHQPLPLFQKGIKQIVIEREDKGPPTIDRCISCHVALQIPYFSPTKIAYDLNGNILRNQEGRPILVPNEDYIWQKLNEKIAELRDEKVLDNLKNQGLIGEAKRRLDEAAKYEALKTVHVNGQVYDTTKVLAMHPLIGNETYPFQFHPIEEYGCTSCHNGNGRGLVTDRAHGPVFDGQYAIEDLGHVPQFTETDLNNDPLFARVFNYKPGAKLIFQTEPIYVGNLIQAKCVQCHQTSDVKIMGADTTISDLSLLRQKKYKILLDAHKSEKQALFDLLKLQQMIEKQGYVETIKQLQMIESNYLIPITNREKVASQIKYLEKAAKDQLEEEKVKDQILSKIDQDLLNLLGSISLIKELKTHQPIEIDSFLKQHKHDLQATGILFKQAKALDFSQDLVHHTQEIQQSFTKAATDKKFMSALVSDIDDLTHDYQRGKGLYLSQACYACHRITGFSRGGIGPELTRAGEQYPWYLKRKLVWPQGDLATSTMPNMHFDSEELEDLMTFLLAQKGSNQAIAKTDYQIAGLTWEAGRKMAWEKSIPPTQIYDLRYAMTVFATQGCAACHRLQGFESNVGFAIEKEALSFENLYEQQHWFKKLFPEVVHFSHYDEEFPGSEIVATIDKHAKEIDERIVNNIRKNSILEEIDKSYPETLESFYSPFRYASRAKNDYYQNLIKKEQNPQKIAQLKEEEQSWKDRVHRVLMMYIQIYGLGRLIGPHLNWSGIYRTDEWLMDHFRSPSIHIPRSIMPTFPFDDTKFYALTHMLDVLAVRNRNAIRQIWDYQGFDPAEAYEMLCAQCHGIDKVGNGVIAEWIYPIPKNLRNSEFLRNLTKNKAIDSITHGVKGTPMPAWGEVAQDKPIDIQKLSHGIPILKENEILPLVDWIFTALPDEENTQSTTVPKWQYTPEDVVKELKKEGGYLIPLTPEKEKEQGIKKQKPPERELPQENNPPPTIDKNLSSLLKRQKTAYASFIPKIFSYQNQKEAQQYNEVEDIFDIIPDPIDVGKVNYYIKNKFYTPYNIAQGQQFFLINCAVCHGNEADGSGVRAQVMQEAKPRILTNLDWIHSRDDLRLLRSIKYGVPGTSMTPWGDLTNTLQRLQLVIFIRSLTKEQEKRKLLFEALYQSFDTAQLTIENFRMNGINQIEQLQQEAQQLHTNLDYLKDKITEGKEQSQTILPIYQKNLEIERKIRELQERDQQLIDLKGKIKSERELYYNSGLLLMSKDLPEFVLQLYLDLIHLNNSRYKLQDHQLVIYHDTKINDQIRSIRQEIINELDKKIVGLEYQLKVIQGKIASAQQREELNAVKSDIEGYKKIKIKLIDDTEEAIRLANEQQNLIALKQKVL